jgi:hypothetical protein
MAINPLTMTAGTNFHMTVKQNMPYKIFKFSMTLCNNRAFVQKYTISIRV